MKQFWIGVDGGGTKTAIAIAAADGKPIAQIRRPGCSYMDLGIDEVVSRLKEGVGACLKDAGASLSQCGGACFGLPCLGENPEMDRQLKLALEAAFGPLPILCVNDVEVGAAGALNGKPGIHIVSGTGAIAFGRDGEGHSARCGGWNEFFGDEGSCYWIGRKAMSLFTKEADGRAPRGALYDLVRKKLSLQDDFSFIDHVIRDIAPHRDRVAAFQTLACEAALAGDVTAQALYDKAAQELALMAEALGKELSFDSETVTVTYSGGLFRTGDLILEPLRARLAQINCTLTPPIHAPLEGALILAIQETVGR